MDFIYALYKLIGMFCVWFLFILLLIYIYRAIRLAFFVLKEKYHKQK